MIASWIVLLSTISLVSAQVCVPPEGVSIFSQLLPNVLTQRQSAFLLSAHRSQRLGSAATTDWAVRHFLQVCFYRYISRLSQSYPLVSYGSGTNGTECIYVRI